MSDYRYSKVTGTMVAGELELEVVGRWDWHNNDWDDLPFLKLEGNELYDVVSQTYFKKPYAELNGSRRRDCDGLILAAQNLSEFHRFSQSDFDRASQERF